RTLSVRDGDAIIAMGEGGPHMIIEPMAARLDHWEPGSGWTATIDGDAWIFMVIDACQNPAVIMRRGGETPVIVANQSPAIEHAPWWNDPAPYRQQTYSAPDKHYRDIPEPDTFWLFIGLMLAVVFLKQRRKPADTER